MWDDFKSFLGFLIIAFLALVALAAKIIVALAPLVLVVLILAGIGYAFNLVHMYSQEANLLRRLKSLYEKRRKQLEKIQSRSKQLSSSMTEVELLEIESVRKRLQKESWELAGTLARVMESDVKTLKSQLARLAKSMAEASSWRRERYEKKASKLREALEMAISKLAEMQNLYESLAAPKKIHYSNGRYDYPKPDRDWWPMNSGALASLGRKRRLYKYSFETDGSPAGALAVQKHNTQMQRPASRPAIR